MCYYQTGFLGLWGKKVDAVAYYETEIEKLSNQVSTSPLVLSISSPLVRSQMFASQRVLVDVNELYFILR